jgi:hypothetical protein
MKIELEKIKTTMIENGIDETTVEAVMTQLEAEAELSETQEESTETEETDTNEDLTDNSEDLPKVKYEYVIILNDKEGYLKDKEIAGWVVQQEENADAGMILGKMKDAAKDQNETAKKKTSRITSMEDMFDGLKPKWLKSKNIRIKTKDLTRVIISNGSF